MHKIIPSFLLIIFMGCNLKNDPNLQYFNATNKLLNYQGRFEVLKDSSVALISSAASVDFLVESDSIHIYVQSDNNSHNYISIIINGENLGRFKVNSKNISKISLQLKSQGENHISIFKATEAGSGAIIFKGIDSQKLLQPTILKKATIEFIGDSITCGAASDTTFVACNEGEYLDFHNAYLAYGPIIARNLHVNFILSSVSGIGIYRNWNDEHLLEPIMPEVYENLYLNTDTSKKYKSSIAPDIVSICIGTNDFSKGDGFKKREPFQKEKFTSNYINFVNTVYNNYPQAKLVLLNSPIIGDEQNAILNSCLEEVAQYYSKKQKTILVFKFDKVYNNGCSYHPSISDHQKMAKSLTPFFKELLKK